MLKVSEHAAPSSQGHVLNRMRTAKTPGSESQGRNAGFEHYAAGNQQFLVGIEETTEIGHCPLSFTTDRIQFIRQMFSRIR